MQSYETTEHKIRREFEAYGPIKRVGTSEWFLKQLTAITIGEMYEWLFYDVSVCWDSSACSEHLKAFVLLKQILRYCLLTPCSTWWLYLVCPPFWSSLICLEAHVFNWVYLKFWFCMEVREYLHSDGCQCLLKYVWQVCPSSCIVLELCKCFCQWP